MRKPLLRLAHNSSYIDEPYRVVHVQEEQESARLQVQSLLNRAEELVLLLQVANIIATSAYTHFIASHHDVECNCKQLKCVCKQLVAINLSIYITSMAVKSVNSIIPQLLT